MKSFFRGLVAAPFTPFHSNGTLNLDVIPAYARHFRRSGVGAAFICGTTGECASLTTQERLQIAEKWMGEEDSKLRVIVHIGHTSLNDAKILAAHAQQAGAAAVAAFAPYFFKPRNTSELVAWCSELASSAPDLPFYYYNIPSMTGVSIPVASFLERAAGRIPSLAGVKYTHEDLVDYEACIKFGNGRYDILFGRDEVLLESLSRGALGAVGSTYNYAAPLYLRLIAAYQSGDHAEARRLQDLAISMISVCNSVGVTHLAASKTLMTFHGVECGPVRLPLDQPDQPQLKQLHVGLEQIGFSTNPASPGFANCAI